MNQELQSIASTLHAVLANPTIAQIPDAELKAQLGNAERLASHLLVELTAVPEIRGEAMRDYAQLALEIGETLPAVTAARELAAIATSADPASFDKTLAAAREVRTQLGSAASSAAEALQKRLIAIEGRCCERIQAALSSGMALQGEQKTVGDASNSKSYDEKKLNDFIVRSFPQEPGIRVAHSHFISGGASKYTLMIELAGTESMPSSVVLRGDNAMSVAFGGADTAYEFRLLKILHEKGVCVPRPLVLESIGDVFGAPFMLSERRPGAMIGHMFMLPPPDPALCADIATQLACIHRVPVELFDQRMRGAGISSSQQAQAMLDESWNNWLALGESSSVIDAAFDWLRRNIAIMDGSRALVHADYGLNNILVEDGRVQAILDWEYAHLGNPACDLGYFYDQAIALSSWEHFLDAYAATGAKMPSQAELDYAILYTATRLAVIVFQFVAAYHQGTVGGVQTALIAARRTQDVSVMRIARLLERIA